MINCVSNTFRISTFFFTLSLFLIAVMPLGDASAARVTGVISLQTIKASTHQPESPYARSRFAESPGSSGNKVDEAIVFLNEHPNLQKGAAPTHFPVMDQLNMAIVPHVLPIQVGTTVDFPNSDNLYHNLFSLSKTKKFDLGRYRRGLSKRVTFERIGVVNIYCDIHPSMSGVILVLPNSYFTMPDAEGKFEIDRIPAGTYELHVWHEKLDERILEVILSEDETMEVNLFLGPR